VAGQLQALHPGGARFLVPVLDAAAGLQIAWSLFALPTITSR
jgi:hypothetical protein